MDVHCVCTWTKLRIQKSDASQYRASNSDQFENLILKLQSTPIKDSNYA